MYTLRNTRQKKIILDALQRADHPTADELYGEIAKDYPTLSRGTVFRVLGQFVQSGVACKLALPDCPARFDARTEAHAHAYCVHCGRVFDVYGAQPPAAADLLPEGFEVYAASVAYRGSCKNCRSLPHETP